MDMNLPVLGNPGIERHSGAVTADWQKPDNPFLPRKIGQSFHEQLRSFITLEVPCKNCTSPLCSCAGYTRGEVCFIPGERAWIESKLGKRFANGDGRAFSVCGDCAFLQNYQCQAKWFKPWDCLAYPVQPTVVDGELVAAFAKECCFHPANLHPRFVLERMKGWNFIYAHHKEWFETVYDPVPTYSQLKDPESKSIEELRKYG